MKKKSAFSCGNIPWLSFYTIVACLVLLGAGFSVNLAASENNMLRFFTGSYSSSQDEGIKCFGFDPRTGKLTPLSGTSGIENPSFLALHSNGKYLYAVSENDGKEGNLAGGVAAYRIVSESGELEKINEVSSGGAAPCHISLDRTEQVLMAANYNGGNVAAFPVMDDGSLGPMSSFHQHTGSGVNPTRQREPHAHSINPSPDNRFALAADLGLDRIFIYSLDPEIGSLGPDAPPFARVAGGSGPRHLAFHPNGSLVYVINEISSTVTAFSYRAEDGDMTEIQTISTLPEGTRAGIRPRKW